ncbi:MAG: hypothetical protein K4571_09285 [Deltaproteobacteria bacterium]
MTGLSERTRSVANTGDTAVPTIPARSAVNALPPGKAESGVIAVPKKSVRRAVKLLPPDYPVNRGPIPYNGTRDIPHAD